jgi:hypothetical protein
VEQHVYHGPRPHREVRAVYDNDTIRVYQAFGRDIALPALEAQTMVPPFSFDIPWASWIKPSFLWTMKRTNWGSYTRLVKHRVPENPRSAVVLGIDVKRSFFDRMLSMAQSTHYQLGFDKVKWRSLLYRAGVYVQWDPEKDLEGHRRQWKAIQLGLRTPVLQEYAAAIIRIQDMSETIRRVQLADSLGYRIQLLPDEYPYPVLPQTAENLEMSMP